MFQNSTASNFGSTVAENCEIWEGQASRMTKFPYCRGKILNMDFILDGP